MKKVIASLVLLMGLSFSVSAEPTGAAFLLGAGFSALANVEYKACNDEPYVRVKHIDGKSNYLQKVTQCEFDAKPSKYVKQ